MALLACVLLMLMRVIVIVVLCGLSYTAGRRTRRAVINVTMVLLAVAVLALLMGMVSLGGGCCRLPCQGRCSNRAGNRAGGYCRAVASGRIVIMVVVVVGIRFGLRLLEGT